MLRRAVLAAVVLSALAGRASAQVQLEWKFKAGDKFYLEQRVVTESSTTIFGMKQAEKQNQQIILSFVVKSADANGYVLEQRIESWRIKSSKDMPGAEGAADKLLAGIFKDVVFVVRISRSGKLLGMEGYEQMMKNLNNLAGPQDVAAFKNIVSEGLMRSWAALTFDILPTKAVKQGEQWRKELDVPIPALGGIVIGTDYTLEEPGKAGHLITFKDKIAFKVGKNEIAPGVKLVKFALSKDQSSGKMIFDAARGRLVELERSVPLTGTATFSAQGMEIEAEINSIENRITRWHDQKPPLADL
jgi:hypothetical protein